MRGKRRIFIFFLSLIILAQPMPASAIADSAGSVILMDAGSGRVLYERNAHRPRMIASITKLMTALVALRSGHEISEVVTIKPEWVGAEGSSMYLRSGEELQLKTLLYGLMLHSGNDAALAVAGYCYGNVEQFVLKMNEMAEQLNMENSHFINPSGLTQDEHYSTAYDMALLARECLKQQDLAQIMSTKTITIEGKSFRNHNKLLWQYDGCIGLKTGYTEKAGRTLVSAARRDGLTLICVTLDDPNDWSDHKELLDYGFTKYKGVTPDKQGEVIGFLPVSGSLLPICPIQLEKEATFAIADGEQVRTQIVLTLEKITAPVLSGTTVGSIIYFLDGTELFRSDLVTSMNVPQNLQPKRNLWEQLREKYMD